jgi:hypothetical protein
MAEKQPHQLTIKIINKTGTNSNANNGSTAPATESGGKATDTTQSVITGTVIARELRSGAMQAFSHRNTIVGLTTGNTVSQERMSYAINAGGKLASYAIAAIAVNPAVAATMMLTDLISSGIGALIKADTLRTQAVSERESLALSRDRAGIAFNQSRMGGAK